MTKTTVVNHPVPAILNVSTKTRDFDQRVDDAVHHRIDACSYRFVFKKVTWQCEDGTLSLSGCLPSFYLKQVLQELLRNIEGVRCILNNVDVVNAEGLSSERHDNSS